MRSTPERPGKDTADAWMLASGAAMGRAAGVRLFPRNVVPVHGRRFHLRFLARFLVHFPASAGGPAFNRQPLRRQVAPCARFA